MPDWHINRTLRRSVRCSEMVRGCCYVHLAEESRQRDDTLVRLVTGKRDSYVSTDVASSLANMFGGPDVLWVVKHVLEMARHRLEGRSEICFRCLTLVWALAGQGVHVQEASMPPLEVFCKRKKT